jgi:hypothetical protein
MNEEEWILMYMGKGLTSKIENSLDRLIQHINREKFRGNDPYDLLNSTFNLQKYGHKLCFLATQIHKRNPINIRKHLGITKDYTPKGMGLFLHAFAIFYKLNPDVYYLDRMNYLYEWLRDNYSRGYRGYCWGLNYDYASADGFFKAYSASIVVTAFIFNGIFEYYLITGKEEIKEVMLSVGDFLLKDILITEFQNSLCFSYTPQKKDLCYNANALASSLLAKLFFITGKEKYLNFSKLSMNYIIEKQHLDGRWNYSENAGIEKKQVDFHQGFILDSISDYLKFTNDDDDNYNYALKKGLEFYCHFQFHRDGRSYWRLPKRLPVDIHNQAQGIITFSKAKKISDKYLQFAGKIVEWTINNMQDKFGYFYYRKYGCFCNKIDYIRWNQAWMVLALGTFLLCKKKDA